LQGGPFSHRNDLSLYRKSPLVNIAPLAFIVTSTDPHRKAHKIEKESKGTGILG
jgi:hypothetical protein